MIIVLVSLPHDPAHKLQALTHQLQETLDIFDFTMRSYQPIIAHARLVRRLGSLQRVILQSMYGPPAPEWREESIHFT